MSQDKYKMLIAKYCTPKFDSYFSTSNAMFCMLYSRASTQPYNRVGALGGRRKSFLRAQPSASALSLLSAKISQRHTSFQYNTFAANG